MWRAPAAGPSLPRPRIESPMRLVDKLRKISAPSLDPVPALRLEARAALRSDALPGEEVEGELGAFDA